MNNLTTGTRGAAYSQAPKQSVQDIVRFWLSANPTGLTRRELSKQGGLEIATLCGELHAMEKASLVHVNRTTTCPTTGREVAVYTLKGTAWLPS